ncbi:MAG: 6-hydroxycyclohex-1-ene-1-carbonyl-CoA dehydrogenase [Deltaproteobacteria bacterium]|nr:6-hydroxycyclohex-1-ene-1-carbonyl-CoA dehydrogenase [Deltaproteobacteria bacterium]
MVKSDAPLERREVALPSPQDDQVLVEIAGCGLCHTDLSFLYGGVKTKKELPLTLGHEFAGTVIASGKGAEAWQGARVIVPAVLPCGRCALCESGRGRICRKQVMPGNDIDGGFATHAIVPARYLCRVPDSCKLDLWELGVIADAVTTPYQAMERARVAKNDLVVVIGVGGIGTYGVQIAAARGAQVIAVDVVQSKLAMISEYGASKTVDASSLDSKQLREAVRSAAKDIGADRIGWKVFEMSGTGAGQATAFDLLTFGGTIGFVGFTMDKIPVRLGNLMAFDATLFGNWGCLPQLYPAALDLVLTDKVKVRPFVERHPLEQINEVLAAAHAHKLQKRAVLTP